MQKLSKLRIFTLIYSKVPLRQPCVQFITTTDTWAVGCIIFVTTNSPCNYFSILVNAVSMGLCKKDVTPVR